MSLPHLLLVDDSDAILSFERAALSAHYDISTASNGRDALAKLERLRPDGVLLDLSMPEMDGEEVFQRMLADPTLAAIPVIVISSERKRGEACLAAGAKAFLPKPLRADELLALVGRVLDDVRKTRRAGSLACLAASVGTIEFGIPLDAVVMIVQQPATRMVPTAPPYLDRRFDLHGEAILILDMAARLGVGHVEPELERKLIVIMHEGRKLALCVDRVRDPEEIATDDVVMRQQIGGAELGDLARTLIAIVRTPRGQLPILAPHALVSSVLLDELARELVGEAG